MPGLLKCLWTIMKVHKKFWQAPFIHTLHQTSVIPLVQPDIHETVSKPKVALIAGAAHGGTTIPNMILGQHPAIFATGKLRDFPHGDIFTDRNICSCGEPVPACPFWKEVRIRFAAYEDKPDQIKIPILFSLISELSGRPFTGDVTHNTGYAELLHGIRDIDLYLIHVVRDGRGVVYSGIRRDYRAGLLSRYDLRHMRKVIKLSRRWAEQITKLSRLERQLGAKAVRIQYEDLCKDPRTALKPVGVCLGLDFDAIGEALGNGQPFQQIPHLLRGNIKLRTSANIVLRQDKAYLTDMNRLDRGIFHLISRMPAFSSIRRS